MKSTIISKQKVAAVQELLNHAKHGRRNPAIGNDSYNWLTMKIEALLAECIVESELNSHKEEQQELDVPEPAPEQPPDVSSLNITDHEKLKIEQNLAVIRWKCSALANGYIEYGTTPELGKTTTKEHRYLPRHTQTIRELEPDTRYFYTIVSRDKSGSELRYSGTFTTKKAVVVDTGSVAGMIIKQWDSTPFYNRATKPTRTIKIHSAGDAKAKLNSSYIQGGDVIEVARGLDVTLSDVDFDGIVSTRDNPVHFEAVGTGNRPIFRGTGSQQYIKGNGAALYRVATWRNSSNVSYSGIRFTGANNHGISVGDRDGNDPGACSNFRLNDCEIDDIGHGGFRSAFGSSNIEMIGGSIHNIGIMPEPESNKKGAGVGEPIYIGKGSGDGFHNKWAARDCTFINVHMYNTFGEVDIKRHSSNVKFIGCLIENMKLWSQGAITAALNPRHDVEYKDYNVGLLIDRCVIRNIRSRRSPSGAEPYGICIGAGNAKVSNSIVDLVHGDCLHAYQDAHNSKHKRLVVENNILIAYSMHKSIEPLGSRSQTNKANGPMDVHASNNIVTTPTMDAKVSNERVVRADQLHTVFAGSQALFEQRSKLSAREHVKLFLPYLDHGA